MAATKTKATITCANCEREPTQITIAGKAEDERVKAAFRAGADAVAAHFDRNPEFCSCEWPCPVITKLA